MLDSLRLPAVEYIVFDPSRTPLVLALCQIQFTRVLGIVDPGFVAPFQRAIQSQYPIVHEARQVGITFEEGEFKQEQQPPQWRFTDKEGNWTVVLAQDFLALETRSYEEFGGFLSRLSILLGALAEHIQPAAVTRLGLRYINEIRPDEPNWTAIIRPELLGPLSVPMLSEHVQQSVQHVQLRLSEEEGINIQHGLLPTGTTVMPRPGTVQPSGPFYLLDFDAFRQPPTSESLPMDPDVVCDYLRTYNEALYRLFRWAITDGFTRTLGGYRGDSQ